MSLTIYARSLKDLGFEEELQASSTLSLLRVSPSNITSKHIVITISGFLSEDQDNSEEWRYAINHFSKAEVYSVKWSALNRDTIFNEGYLRGKKKKNFL
mmetsp:Transcript_32494/g.31744  ORF Transcript_32494/g.31744 Transcript_32494/m.31744 type:complete len:99 (+) Transcript_32494:524-820(+)